MPSKEDHWQQVYQTADHSKLGWYQHSPDQSLQFLASIDAQPGQAIIDVGCGESLLVDQLLDMGFEDITLLDISRHALLAVKSRLGEQAAIPNFLNQDICEANLDKQFDIWHDRAVFHFLTGESDRRGYLSTLRDNLAANGHALIATFSINGPTHCSGLEVRRYNDAKMRAALTRGLRLIDSETSLHSTPNGNTQEYCYFHIGHD